MKGFKNGLAIFLAAALLFLCGALGAGAGPEEKTAAGLVQHAIAQKGNYYWYGTFGQAPTQWLLDQKRAQYPNVYSAQVYNNAKKQVGAANKRVYDCAGLVKSYWYQSSPTAVPVYRSTYDQSAHGLYLVCNKRGAIASLPEVPGTLVFMADSKGIMTHVGIYIGGGQVVEAAFGYGAVVQTALKGRGWTHWGQLPPSWLTYEAEWEAGDRARVKPGTKEYSPGVKMAFWVPGQVFIVSQVEYKGKPVVNGGKRCVLLKEANTWCAVEVLEKL